ncbi:MAG: glycosyltransferase family 2 protein [Terriglobia bacterium]
MPVPRFSIIITSYNQREFIKDAVNSALSVRNTQSEIIVVDDASSDGTPEILRQFGGAIRVICRDTNQGAAVVRNCGAALATGEYLVFLDGDDAFLPWALEVYERIAQAKKPKMILGRLRGFEGRLPALQTEDTPRDIRSVEYLDYLRKDRAFDISASALVIDRESFQGAQGWSWDAWPMDDQDLVLRLGNCGRTIQVVAPHTAFYRSHAANTSKNVPPFVAALGKIIHNERAGEYPGGKRRRRERRAIIGKEVVFWSMKAAKAGLYGASLKLLARGWTMACVAVTRRLGVALKGRQPCETLKM